MAVSDRIQELEEKLKKTPVNKGTETARAKLKAQIAKLKEKEEKQQQKGGGGGHGYAVKKRGDATVALVGPPSAGKSTLLTTLTDAESETGSYAFTTLTVVPGMLTYRGAQIQLLDVPGLIEGAAQGKGRGKEVLSVVRNADLIVLLTDVERIDALETMQKELYGADIRLNQTRPDVHVEKKDRGGLVVNAPRAREKEELFIEALRSYGLVNAVVTIREDISVDSLLDALSPSTLYLPGLSAINKVDMLDANERNELHNEYPDAVLLSAKTEAHTDALKERIWDKLSFVRIYMKKPGEEADTDEPLVMRGNPTVRNVCERLHRDMANEFSHARLWGSSSFPGQKVGLDRVLQDEDILELHTS